MPCSASSLLADMLLWNNIKLTTYLTASYQNLSKGDKYDCGLTSVPCESNVTKAFVLFDSDLVYMTDVVITYVLLPAVTISGVFGNIINVIILSTNNIVKDSTNSLLLGTAISDLSHTVVLTFMISNTFACFFDESLALNMFNITTFHLHFTNKCLGMLSLDFITVMSLQRAAAVIFPFKLSQIFSNRNTNIIIGVLVLAFVLMDIPCLAVSYPKSVFHPYFGKHIFLGHKTFYDYDTLLTLFNTFYILRCVIDLLLLLISASVTVYNLKMHGKARSSLKQGNALKVGSKEKSNMSNREVKIIKMTTAVCYTSFAIYFVECMSSIQIVVFGDALFSSTSGIMVAVYSKMTIGVVCSFNFFLYLTMSLQFRTTFIKMFKPGNRLS